MAVYTVDDIMLMRAVAFRLKLDAPEDFFHKPVYEMILICNGIGGEGSRWNPVLDFVFLKFHLSGAIHDVGYFVGGTEVDRKRVDDAFKGNMVKEWKFNHSWWDRWFKPMVRYERKMIEVAYVAVRIGGGKYFLHKDNEAAADRCSINQVKEKTMKKIIVLVLACSTIMFFGCSTTNRQEGAQMAKAAQFIDKVFNKAVGNAPAVIDALVLDGKITPEEGAKYKAFIAAYDTGGPMAVFEQWAMEEGAKQLTEDEKVFVTTLLKGDYNEAGVAAIDMMIQKGVDEGKLSSVEALVFKAMLATAYEEALAAANK